MDNINTAKQKILPHIVTLFPDLSAVGLGGSRAKNQEHRYSDWDFVVIDNTRSDFSNEAQYVGAFNCEIFIGSTDAWKDVISKRREQTVPVFMEMIKDSVVLQSSNEYDELQKYAHELYGKGPKPLTQVQIDFIVQQLEFVRDKVAGVGFENRPLFKQGIINNLIDSWYDLENCWRVKSADKDTFIREMDSYFYENLVECIAYDDWKMSSESALQIVRWLIDKGNAIQL